MTIKEFFYACDHISHSNVVQVYKSNEAKEYYGNVFENLSIQRMTFGQLLDCWNAKIEKFWFEGVSRNGDVNLIMILLEEGETL